MSISFPSCGARVPWQWRRAWWITLAMIVAVARGVSAQDSEDERLSGLSLEELLHVNVDKVYSASRFIQDVRRAPASVTVLTAADIRRFGYRTLADALRSTVGFYTTYDRNYTYLGVRGFGRPGDYNSRVLILIDGHRYNDGVYDEALIGTEFPIDMALVDRIEIIRGPSSSLYGSSAFFGVINIMTRRGDDIRGAEVQLDAGSLSTRRARLSAGTRTSKGVELLLSGTTYESGGQPRLYFKEFDAPESNGGIAEHMDDDTARSVLGRISYRDFSIEGGWASRRKRVPTAAFDTVFASPAFRTTDARFFATAQYGHRPDEQTEVVGRLFFDAMRYRGAYPYETPSLPVDLYGDASAWDGVGGEFIASRRFAGRNLTTVGVELRNSFRADQWAAYADEPLASLDSKATSRKWAVFGQQEFAVTPAVLVNAGFRYDHDRDFGGSLNPRLGVILTPAPSTTFKLLQGTAFRAPSAYELHYWSGQGMLDPETIRTSEVIWQQKMGAAVGTSVSAFYNVIEHLISEKAFGGESDIQFVNSDRAIARGVEWTIEGRWPRGILARFGQTLEHATDGTTGLELSNAPRHLSKIQFGAPIFSNRFSIGADAEYMSGRLTVHGEQVSAFYRQNLTFDARGILGHLDARFSVGNLFDQQYGDPGGEEHRQAVIAQDGRTALFTLTYRK
jgi:outer membrane receptor for ferrienterochelin and colicins